MGIYNSAVITNTGQALLAQSVAGNDLKFTTVKTSNYTYPSGTSLADLTTLTGIKQSKNVTGANVYNSRVIKVSAMVDNAGVTAEYTINTIGVYATVGTAAEQLFAVITAQEADKMPAFNSRPYSYIYDLNMTMQGTSNITVTVNNAGFVNINDLNNALDGVNDSITDLDETVNDRIDTLNDALNNKKWYNWTSNMPSAEVGSGAACTAMVDVNTVCVALRTTNKAHAEDNLLLTIPTGYRPLVTFTTVAKSGQNDICIVSVSTNGQVTVWSIPGSTSGRLITSFSYVRS